MVIMLGIIMLSVIILCVVILRVIALPRKEEDHKSDKLLLDELTGFNPSIMALNNFRLIEISCAMGKRTLQRMLKGEVSLYR
jgi:hypothetical protein